MARSSREIAESSCYHVILRGNGKQILFEDDEDYETFLLFLKKALEGTDVALYAWCLMDNHVHLCLRDTEAELDKVMRRLGTRYAMYFNNKTGHVGHVFQSRFTSAPIENERYLFETIRYIHNNPCKAGISSAEAYRWSSYREYIEKPELCEVAGVLGDLGGVEGFREFINGCPLEGFRPPAERRVRVSDEEAREIAAEIYPGMSMDAVKSLPLQQRNAVLVRLKSEGISARQLERLTGIGRNLINRAVR